ncbi:MAG TPA: hypothetical protein VN653_19075 [Anaerolineales bacterium]|nr:hypothetical protein [Anaerolineales bacterium]
MELLRALSSLLSKFTKVLMLVAILGSFRPSVVSAATEYNEKVVFTDEFDACSGERLTVSGVQHIVGHLTQDARGRFHYVFTRNTQGTGIGQTSGDRYILIDTVAQLSLEVLQGQPRTSSQEYHSVMIHLGEKSPHDDTIIHFLSKILVDANGEVTTLIEIKNVDCR